MPRPTRRCLLLAIFCIALSLLWSQSTLPDLPTLTHTAGTNPELLDSDLTRLPDSTWLVLILCVVIALGFGFRVVNLGAESFGEDELNKLMAVADYRAHGLTAANGEHPMLMKVAQTVSVVACEKWNGLMAAHPGWQVTTEASLRFPGVLLGTFTALLLFLLVKELFGNEIALLTAALWALDPNAIGFNRIAKEDTFVLFFFLLANVFWLRGQRVAESGAGHPTRYYWATAMSFGAMIASKYLPHFLGISVGYYYVFQGIPATKWRLGKVKFLIFLTVMGLTFLVCNPAIVLPATWQQMRAFAGEHRIGHDSYEFIGTLYRNQSSLWFKGIPWYFYFAFILFKTPIPVLIAAVVGVPRFFAKQLGDGRYFVLVWILFFYLPFSVLGGKFTRYFTLGLPIVHIAAAVGIHWISTRIAARHTNGPDRRKFGTDVFVALALITAIFSAAASASVTPNFRLYTSVVGGGWANAGDYFPHDEFYDGATKAIVSVVNEQAHPGALVLTETPGLYAYYSRLIGRDDLTFMSLSDPAAISRVKAGDIVVFARGRRYFSNERVTSIFVQYGLTSKVVNLGPVPAARVYLLNDPVAREIASGR